MFVDRGMQHSTPHSNSITVYMYRGLECGQRDTQTSKRSRVDVFYAHNLRISTKFQVNFQQAEREGIREMPMFRVCDTHTR